MQILLTNDDGIDAPGLAALERVAQEFGAVTVAAPHREYSGCGHQVTNHAPVRVEQVDRNRFRVFGTPADCARVGIRQLAPHTDIVLSGVNEGGNLGVDVLMSGTVAAAREAVWLGKHSISFSQYVRRERPRDWDKTTEMVRRTLAHLQSRWQLEKSFWNVNLPDDDTPVEQLAIAETHVEPQHLPVGFEEIEPQSFAFRSDYRNRPRETGSDVDVCFGGAISVSQVAANP